MSVRKKCANVHEEDEDPAPENYCYTSLIDLKVILEHNWTQFVALLPKAVAGDRKQLFNGLIMLNRVRNRVMHPSKGVVITEQDFANVRAFINFLEPQNWKESESDAKSA